MGQKLGQHFLKNTDAINKIIAALDIKNGETVIEIGPGKGALTLPMAENVKSTIFNFKIIAIEKDGNLAMELKNKIQDLKLDNIEIIEGDALTELQKITQELKNKDLKFKIVGNIPYYITGKLLRTISELKYKPELTVLMIQKEVAERITAVPLKTNLLSAATQFWAKPEIILRLKPVDFDPAPEVDSAVIKLTTKIIIPVSSVIPAKAGIHAGDRIPHQVRNDTEKSRNDIERNYYKLIHIIFKQPRKTLLNNLRTGSGAQKDVLEKTLNSLNLAPNSRPQDLSISDILKLSSILKNL